MLRARLGLTSVYRNRMQTQRLADALVPLLTELKTTPGVEPADLIDAYENAGHLAIEQRRPADAVAAADQALALLQRHLAADEARAIALSLLRSVALTYMQPPQRALAAAEQTLRRALALWGAERPHARVLDVRGVYGRALGNAGFYRQAADELSRVVAEAGTLLGPAAPMVAFTAADVARFELAADRPAVALTYAERSLVTLDKAGIEDPFSRTVVLSLKGQASLALRRPQALAVLQQAHALAVSSRGADSPTAGHIAAYLALAQARSGQLQRALETLQAVPAPDVAGFRALAFNLRHHLGVVLRLAGDAAGAHAAQQSAWQLLADDANDAWRRQQVQIELARLALDAGDPQPGLALASTAAMAPPGGPRDAERLVVLGLALRAAGRTDDAREALALQEAFWRDASANAAR